MSSSPPSTDTFRWDRLTYSSALGYALLAGGQSIGFVLGELRQQFGLSGVTAALHGSVFGLAALIIGYFGVSIIDRLGRRTSMLCAATGITVGITTFCLGPAWPVTLAGAALAGLSGALLAIRHANHGAGRARGARRCQRPEDALAYRSLPTNLSVGGG